MPRSSSSGAERIKRSGPLDPAYDANLTIAISRAPLRST